MKTSQLFSCIAVGAASLLLLAFSEPGPVAPQAATPSPSPTSDDSENLRSTLEVFRSDLNTAKIKTLNQVMRLTESEAEKFWPIYRAYEQELSLVGDRKVALIKEFITLNDSNGLNDKNAADLAERWLKIQQDRLDLWKKYNKEVSAAVSPIRGAQFLQVENQISLLIDINIASEMPVVGHSGGQP